MLRVTYLTIMLSCCIILGACTNVSTKEANNNGAAQWDFDHQLQFRQTTLENNSYQLEIIPNNRVSFERSATFLLRKSYRLCGSYHYKLEILRGIEGFDDKRAMPNYIFPSLIAKVECNTN